MKLTVNICVKLFLTYIPAPIASSFYLLKMHRLTSNMYTNLNLVENCFYREKKKIIIQ